MRLFKCQSCGQLIYFENRQCERCGHRLGYVPSESDMVSLDEAGEVWQEAKGRRRQWRFCDNAGLNACNWLLPAEGKERFCTACRHNRTVPDLSDEENLVAWRKMEIAKHRLIYTLMRLRLPLPNRDDDPKFGLVFDFLADSSDPDKPQVLTGHEDGLVTLALKEADDAERERRRTQMGEPYRTLLGHFRHEVGHYYWDRLVADERLEEEFRGVFGDEREDYSEALKRHYETGPPADWQERFVSTYATTHAWEDWAESWAHYLHIIESLETAGAFGMEVHPQVGGPDLHTAVQLDPFGPGNFAGLIDAWLPLTYAMNGMNRSMGLADLYPFILSAPAIAKMAWIHDLVHRERKVDRAGKADGGREAAAAGG